MAGSVVNSNKPAPKEIRIGIDIGGTFTDLAIVDQDGFVRREKAFTTPGKWYQGILAGLTSAAKNYFDLTLAEFLPLVVEITHGTTIVTNVMAQMNGVRVGLITTQGFGDTLRIARSARQNLLDLQVQAPPPQIVAHSDIVEAKERIDSSGNVIVPIDPKALRRDIRKLVEQGVEALAVSLAFSFENPSHEHAVRDLAKEEFDDLPVFLSSDVHPVIREYERTVTTVLNAYVSFGVTQYLTDLQAQLKTMGLRVPIGVMQCTGGVTSIEDVLNRPLQLLHSGPVGGVIAARDLSTRLDLPKVICADMGGTSFDTALIEDGRVGRTNRAEVERLKTGLTLVDVVSIGTGGGSIAHLDVAQRPQLGPRSAGAKPGPISYHRGGTEPTMTDIAVTLNLLNPEGFLGGRHGLDIDAARRAIDKDLGQNLCLDVLETCRGYYRIGVAAMAQAVRAVTVERGRDPRDFVLLSYGGASGMVIAEIAKQIGITKVVVPETASVFSAFGMLCGDLTRTNSKTVNWNVMTGNLDQLRQVRSELLGLGVSRLGDGSDAPKVSWEADLKFGSQAFELTVQLAPFEEVNDETRKRLLEAFQDAYELRYGKGTLWVGAEHLVMLVNLRSTVSHSTTRPEPKGSPVSNSDEGASKLSCRTVYWPQMEDAGVMSVPHLGQQEAIGPMILEAGDTTIYLPTGWTAKLDEWRNLHLEQHAGAGK